MKFDSASNSTPPSPQQLTELHDVLVSATELHRLYDALARHPRVMSSSGSSELFQACMEQVALDIALLDEQLEALQSLARSAPIEIAPDVETAEPTPYPPPADSRFRSLPDVEPTDLNKSVSETVQRAFNLEDFLHQQLSFSLLSAQERKHLRLELQLKMIILSAEQRCKLLEDRYGFARSKSPLMQGFRRQTTRLLSKISGEKRDDID